MRKVKFEEQLTENMADLEIFSAEIYSELDLIYQELFRREKWDDFIVNLDKTSNEECDPVRNLTPEMYYECLHYAFGMVEKHDDFRCCAEITITENSLLNGKGIDSVEMSAEMLAFLKSQGIGLEPVKLNILPIRNDHYDDRISALYIKSRKILTFMEKTLKILRESKTYIFSQY